MQLQLRMQIQQLLADLVVSILEELIEDLEEALQICVDDDGLTNEGMLLFSLLDEFIAHLERLEEAAQLI